MRLRIPHLLFLGATLAWLGCERPVPEAQESHPLAPVFAKGGAQCDTKGAPVRDYFTSKADQQVVNELFRDLGTACANEDDGGALTAGFAILSAIETARADRATGDPSYGAEVAGVAWSVMRPFTCPPDFDPVSCTAPVIDAYVLADLTLSLSPGGAFGVRSSGSDPVVSWGNDVDLPYWFIEPYGYASWSTEIPGGTGLVFGYFSDSSEGDLPNERGLGPPLANVYDWTVFRSLYDGTAPGTLSVTMCEEASLGYIGKLAHGGVVLQEGNDDDGFCATFEDPLAASAGFGTGLLRLASSVVPFWPQTLHASVKGSGATSGSVRTFSPFFGKELDPEGKSEFTTIPGDAAAFTPLYDGNGDLQNAPQGSQLICEVGAPLDPGDTTCPAGYEIEVRLRSGQDSPLSGDELVMLVVTAEDNNGSWTLYGTYEGVNAGADELVYQWNDLSLDKPGAYKLHTYRTDAGGCVFADDGSPILDDDGVPLCGPNTIGLAFPAASSEKFLVNP